MPKSCDIGIDLLINQKKAPSIPGSPRAESQEHNAIVDDILSVRDEPIQTPRSIGSYSREFDRSEFERRGDYYQHPPTPLSVREPPRNYDDEKRELLYQFDRLERRGVKLSRKFTMQSSYEEMKSEYDRVTRDREIDASIRFQRKLLMTCVSGIEYLNGRFDPFDIHLDGWSENVNDSIGDYDEVFEELHDKYSAKVKVAPEIKLLFMIGGSATMFHLSKTLFSSSMPGLSDVLKSNPDLAKQFASAAMKSMMQEEPQPRYEQQQPRYEQQQTRSQPRDVFSAFNTPPMPQGGAAMSGPDISELLASLHEPTSPQQSEFMAPSIVIHQYEDAPRENLATIVEEEERNDDVLTDIFPDDASMMSTFTTAPPKKTRKKKNTGVSLVV